MTFNMLDQLEMIHNIRRPWILGVKEEPGLTLVMFKDCFGFLFLAHFDYCERLIKLVTYSKELIYG